MGVRRWLLYEWDMDFGDMLHREYHDSEEEAVRALEEYISEAGSRGWECTWIDSRRAVCTKCEEGEDGERACYQRELGVEPA